MKKFFACLICVACLLTMSVNVFAASGLNADEQAILDRLSSVVTIDGKEISIPADMLNQAENYLRRDDVDLTADQKTAIIAEIDKAAEAYENEGIATSDLTKLSKEAKQTILAAAQKAGEIAGVTVSYDVTTKVVTIKDSTGAVVAESSAVVKTTGADYTSLAIAMFAVVAIVAGCAVVAGRKKLFVK